MMANFFRDEKEITELDDENAMNETCKQRGNFKKNRNKRHTYVYYHKETSEISGSQNQESGLSEFHSQNLLNTRATEDNIEEST